MVFIDLSIRNGGSLLVFQQLFTVNCFVKFNV